MGSVLSICYSLVARWVRFAICCSFDNSLFCVVSWVVWQFLEALLISFVFQEFAAGETCPPAGQQLLLEFMCAVVDIAGSSCDVMISPPPLVVMGSGIVLLLQVSPLSHTI